MARYIKLDQDKINRLKREAQQFQDDIVCGVGTDFMQKIAEAENRMIFDIFKGLEDDTAADVVPKSEVESINPIQEAIEQKKKENKGFALGVLNELLDEKDVEIKRLEYTLTGVMHSVDKWLDGEELEQDEVNRAITMREKTLRIIEDAKSEIERLEKDNKKLTINMNAFGLTAIRQKEEKEALVVEIEGLKLLLEDAKDCWQKIHDSYTADCVEHYNKGHQEIAREIFEGIWELVLAKSFFGEDSVILHIDEGEYERFKKKYTESEDKV